VQVLLDENLLSKKLKRPLIEAGYSVSNVDDMGWRGFKDREILNLAQAHPFDVFITADKNLIHQQSLTQRSLRIVVLNSSSTRPDHLLPLIVELSPILLEIPSGTAISINDAAEITQIHP
jgi:predicted nuclease of predicted toxin-antitoxin system